MIVRQDTDRRRETEDRRSETRDKKQKTRDKRQETRDKRQETRDKIRVPVLLVKKVMGENILQKYGTNSIIF